MKVLRCEVLRMLSASSLELYASHGTLPGSALMASTTFALARHVSILLMFMPCAKADVQHARNPQSHGDKTWTEALSVRGLLCVPVLGAGGFLQSRGIHEHAVGGALPDRAN